MPDGIITVLSPIPDFVTRLLLWNMQNVPLLWNLIIGIMQIWYISLRTVAIGISNVNILMDTLIPAVAICALNFVLPICSAICVVAEAVFVVEAVPIIDIKKQL